MSSLSKNLLLGLTVVCIIAVIVFCIQLIIINSGVDRNQPGSASGTPGQSTGDDGDEAPDGENGDGEESGTAPVATPRPPPQGTRHQISISDNNILVIYAREEIFEYEDEGLEWLFHYIAGGTATLEIVFTMIPPAQSGGDHAESFLNRYTGGTDAAFTREEMIQGSTVSGFHASARHGNNTYEVWIHDIVGNDVALAFVIQYENDQQKEALYDVLGTLDILRIGDMVIPPPDHGDAGDGIGIGNVDGTGNDDGGDDGGDD